jgi:hypothetical protein
LNFAFVIIPHSIVAFKLPILKVFFSSMLASTFAFNGTFQYSTLASNLLAIVVRVLDCDNNILILVIGMSSNVPIDVIVGFDDGFNVSLNIGLGLGLGEE